MVARFLIGRRDAILALADAKGGLWLGAAFVMTAALARRYDQADLIGSPHLLFMPLLISGANATLLALYWRLIRNGVGRPAFLTEWRRIVTLFWMTAPLAWLYGIPWERMLDPLTAMTIQLWTLFLVSLWRVLLTMRFLAVLAGTTMGRTFCFLMVFADAVALVLIEMAPRPMVAIMGGVSGSEVDRLVAAVTLDVAILGLLTFPLWLVLALAALFARPPTWATVAKGRLRFADWLPVILATIVFAVPTIWTQPKQRLAARVNQLLVEGRAVEAVDLASAHRPDQFPPNFDPRPRRWTGQNSPGLWSVIIAIGQRPDTPDWVRELWYRKLRQELDQTHWNFGNLTTGDLPQGARALAGNPAGVEIMEDYTATKDKGTIYDAFQSALGRDAQE